MISYFFNNNTVFSFSLAAKHGLDEPPPEVSAMISHATEERLKTLIEKLAVISEHRLDVIKVGFNTNFCLNIYKKKIEFLNKLDFINIDG